MPVSIIATLKMANELYGVAETLLSFFDETISDVLTDVADANISAAERNWRNVKILKSEGKNGDAEANRAVAQLEQAYEILKVTRKRFGFFTSYEKELRVEYKRYSVISSIVGFYANQQSYNLIKANYLPELRDSFFAFAEEAISVARLECPGRGIIGYVCDEKVATSSFMVREYILSHVLYEECGLNWGKWLFVYDESDSKSFYESALEHYREYGCIPDRGLRNVENVIYGNSRGGSCSRGLPL